MANDNDFLVHYGIKGQKWGLRRFQNEDRTLTEAGKERYSKSGSGAKDKKKLTRKEKRQAAKEAKEAAKPESERWKSSEAKFLSDEELNRRNSRLQRERQYIDMTTPQWKKNLKRGAIGLITALTTVPLAGIVTEEVRRVYRGKFNDFVAPLVSQHLGVDKNVAQIKVK